MEAVRRRGACAIGAFVLAAGLASAGDRTADVKRLLGLLDGIRIEYTEAFDDDEGELTRPIELEEARELLAEARQLGDGLQLVDAAAFETMTRELRSVVLTETLPDLVTATIARIEAATGETLQTLPPEPPSAARGQTLYTQNCAVCHGADGAGAGDDAERRRVQFVNFRERTFMRRETPLDFFTMISLGRRKTAMPEFSTVFSVQQRWDVIAYLWTLAHTDADRDDGRALWTTHCAACHGERGEGADGKAADLRRPGSLVDRNDLTLVTRLAKARGDMPSFAGVLDDRQRWLVADRLRALSLGGVDPRGPAVVPAVAASSTTTLPPAAVDPRRALGAARVDADTLTRDVGAQMRRRFAPPTPP